MAAQGVRGAATARELAVAASGAAEFEVLFRRFWFFASVFSSSNLSIARRLALRLTASRALRCSSVSLSAPFLKV